MIIAQRKYPTVSYFTGSGTIWQRLGTTDAVIIGDRTLTFTPPARGAFTKAGKPSTFTPPARGAFTKASR